MIRTDYIRCSSNTIPIVKDAREYLIYGYNLAHHSTFSQENSPNPSPDSFRSPGYPLLIALCFFTGNEQTFYPILVYTQAILSSLTVLLTFFLGICFLPRWGAVIAAFFVAFSPHLIAMTGYMLTETLFSFMLLSAIFCFQYAVKHRSGYLFVASGLFFGYSYLTNEGAVFIPFLFAYSAIGYGSIVKLRQNPLLPNILIFMLIFVLFPCGWTLRNHISLAPNAKRGSDRAIGTMSHGAYPDFIYKNPEFRRFPYREDPMQPEFGASLNGFCKILWERFREEPLRYLRWYFIGKPYYLWSWNIIQGVGDVYVYPVKDSLFETSAIAGLTRDIMRSLHPVILIFALAGIVVYAVRYRYDKNRKHIENTAIFILITVAYFTLLYMIFAPWPRYSIPLRPELYLWAIWAVADGTQISGTNPQCRAVQP